MSNQETGNGQPNEQGLIEEIDRDLSALTDRALDREREAELLLQIQSNPRVAARRDAFDQVNQALRQLSGSPLPADLRAKLSEQMNEQVESGPGRGTGWRVPLASAIAAAAAVFAVVLLNSSEQVASTTASNPPAAQQQAEVARGSDRLGELDPASPEAAVALYADAIPDEDLAIALDYETLQDLELIRELEAFEALLTLSEDGWG